MASQARCSALSSAMPQKGSLLEQRRHADEQCSKTRVQNHRARRDYHLERQGDLNLAFGRAGPHRPT